MDFDGAIWRKIMTKIASNHNFPREIWANFRGTQRIVSVKYPFGTGFHCEETNSFLWQNVTSNFRNIVKLIFFLFLTFSNKESVWLCMARTKSQTPG